MKVNWRAELIYRWTDISLTKTGKYTHPQPIEKKDFPKIKGDAWLNFWFVLPKIVRTNELNNRQANKRVPRLDWYAHLKENARFWQSGWIRKSKLKKGMPLFEVTREREGKN